MKIIVLTVGQLATNCYLLISKKTKKVIIIDPGDEANYIAEQIIKEKLRPKMIILTHGHFDHLLGAGEIQQIFHLPLAINYQDLFLLENSLKSAGYWLKQKIVFLPPKPTLNLGEKATINFDNFKIKIIKTPGHTPGSICLYQEKEKIIFTGDTLFFKGVGRTDFSYSNQKALKNSLAKLKKLLPATIYPGHGNWGFYNPSRASL